MQRDAILTAVERYYSQRFSEHGPSARGVDWNSEESQELRFEQLAQLIRADDETFSVNDLGCGYGAFADFLARHRSGFAYTGYELSEAMLSHARERFGPDGRVEFRYGSAMTPADYSFASGVFNVKLGFADAEWYAYVDATLDALADASNRGFAFNMLSTYSDPERRRADLFYADPRVVFDRCKKRYSERVALLHDYPLWEFTTIVRFE
jgi:SAM-dependent methyltransferase